MEEVVKLNGQTITRESVRDWLVGKRVTLWSDWCVTDPGRREEAIDWFMGEMSSLSAASTTGTKGKKAKSNGKSTARSTR